MKRVLIGVIAFVVVLVAAVVILPFVIPPETIKERIIAEAREATGRELRIDGAFELDLGLTTSVRMEGISFQNAAWGSRPELAKIASLSVTVEILPLLSGRVVIPRLAIGGADILLETNDKGLPNWAFQESESADGEADGGGDSGGGVLPQLGELALENITVVYKDGVSGEQQQVALTKLGLIGEGADGPLKLELDARWNEEPITGAGTLPNLATLASGGAPIPMKLALRAFALAIGVDGTVTPASAGPSFDLALTVKGKNLAGLRPLAGDALPKAGPLDLSTGIKGGPDALTLKGLKLVFGKTDLAGDLTVSTKGARPRLDGTLTSKRIDLNELMPPEAKGGAGGKGATATEKKARVFSEEPLPLDGLKAADAKLELTIGELITPSLPLKDVKVSLSLEGGKLKVAPFSTKVADSDLAGAVLLDGAAATPTLDLKLNSKALDLGKLLTQADVTDMLQGTASLDVALTGRGGSVAAIMASLSGHSRLLMGEGRAKTEAFDVLVGGLSQVMGSLFSKKSKWTVVECIASDFEIKDGLATSKVNAINTEHVLVIGEGEVDLGKEALKMKLTPKPKSATLNVSVPIKVGGTFLEPSFAPDELATARRLGGLLGAAVFPPAALIALGDLGDSDNPCLKEIGEGGQAQPETSSGGPADAVKDITKDPAKALEGVGSGIKKLFGK